MAKDTLTFELGGQVDLKDFVAGIRVFQRLVSAITPRSVGVVWEVADLHPGSASTTIQGVAGSPSAIEKIVADYGQIGAALARRENPKRYNKQVERAVDAIKNLNHSIEYIRFETPDNDFTVYRNGDDRAKPTPTVSLGAVTGRVQTLSNRVGLRFNLYDTVHDKAVGCYLASDQEELIRHAWGRWATVAGKVSREPLTGRPIAIRQITALETLSEAAPGAYREARGILPRQPGDPLPEDVIRKMRDD